MLARASPHDRGRRQIGRNGGRHGQPPRHRTGEARISLAEELALDRRMHAIGPDQEIAVQYLPGIETHPDLAALAREGRNAGARVQFRAGLLARVRQHGDKIGAVDVTVGRPVAPARSFPHWD